MVKFPDLAFCLFRKSLIHFLLRLPIHYAAVYGFFEIVFELLEKNSDQAVIDAQDLHGG